MLGVLFPIPTLEGHWDHQFGHMPDSEIRGLGKAHARHGRIVNKLVQVFQGCNEDRSEARPTQTDFQGGSRLLAMIGVYVHKLKKEIRESIKQIDR